jgi:cysteinyl-tRNA synthetase
VRLYDTRARAVVSVTPASDVLKIYACGPTVYRYAHVGNLRTFLLLDLITRLAHLNSWKTSVIQNITDVGHLVDDTQVDAQGEDKILEQAKLEGKDPFAIARFYEDAFHKDLKALNVLPADVYPRASESIQLIIDLCQKLEKAGHAYVGTDGSLFFDARSFPTYGALSGNSLDHLKPGHRLEDKDSEAKRFHADWALWKNAGTDRAMTWPSPWGNGFPGWHIECSAMSLEHLGDSIDIHLGGIDLRFPHHEDERAQSNSAAGREVVKHWIHGEHLLFEGRKMSKSSGNVVLVSDLIERGLDPLALRLSFLESRYRTQLDLSWAAISAAHKTITRWRSHLAEWRSIETTISEATQAWLTHGLELLQEDLNSPALIQLLRRIEKDETIPPDQRAIIFDFFDHFLGLDLGRLPEHESSAEIDALLAERESARRNGQWKIADELRNTLAELGIEVRDTATGQVWEKR